MQRPSWTLIFSGIFLAYILRSIYTLSLLFVAPTCESGIPCLKTYLKTNPSLELHLFTSTASRPIFKEVSHVYSASPFNYTRQYEIPINMNIPMKTRNNGTLFLHVIVVPKTPRGHSKSFNELYRNEAMSYTRIKITQFAVPQAKAFNLLRDKKVESENAQKKENTEKAVSHLRSRVTFTMMTDDIELPSNAIPMELTEDIRVTRDGFFLPMLKYDFLQTRYKDLVPISKENDTMDITIIYSPISLGKLRLVLHVEAAMNGLKNLGFSDKDIDEVKGIYADTNVYLLAGTIFIASMHLLFDFLAFKNDISFWRSKSNLEGLSTTTVVWRAFSQTIVFLYLLDEGSSLLILLPAAVASLIEMWKSKKILRLEIVRSGGFFPKIIRQRSNYSSEAKTREFDTECLRYLSYLLYPLIIGGAIYSLLYQPHKSWYSWSLSSLANGVYAFGFLFMLPQLFVNYKLKSVAHLPWRSFMYKAFNTFIDDVFAFIITMPVAHRVACFRDDVVFFIYLYQRWLYPVDKDRQDPATIMLDPSVLDSTTKKKEE